MIGLGINCYIAYYEGDYGWLKLTPSNKVQFLSAKEPIEIDIKCVKDASLWDSVGVPELSDAILIETYSGKSYSIALEQADEFARKLEVKIDEVRNIEYGIAS